MSAQSQGAPLNSTWLLATPGNQYAEQVLYQPVAPWAVSSAQSAVWNWWWFQTPAPVVGNTLIFSNHLDYVLP